MYPTGCVPPKFYGLPKIHKPDKPLRPIVSSCGSVTYGVAKELAKILKPLVGKSPHHINTHPGLCWTGQTLQIGIWWMSQFLWCVCPVHLCPHGSCPQYHQGFIGQRQHPQGKDSYGSWGHYPFIGILSQKHIFFFPRPVLWTGWGCCHGFPS